MGLKVLSILFVILFASSKGADPKPPQYDGNDDTIMLNPQNFNSYVYNPDSKWLVVFYAEWCGWSRKFAPDVKTLATQLKGYVNVGVVDSVMYPELKNRFNVQKYPSIYIINGYFDQTKYMHKRTVAHILQTLYNKFYKNPNQFNPYQMRG
ncbi:unnamed protein product [Diamesa serratosioi]